MAIPGKPVPFYSRYRKIPGDRKGRYFDSDSGRIVSRFRGQTELAHAYGFTSLADYYDFSRVFNGGLGGLTGLNPIDVKRTKFLLERYADEQGVAIDRLLFEDPRTVNVAKIFMEGSGRRKGEALNIFLNRIGVRQYTADYLPGMTPGKRQYTSWSK